MSIPTLQIDSAIHPLLKDFTLPSSLGFGTILAPIMFIAKYEHGAWQTAELKPYAPVAIDPAAKVLHYASSIFEGMKAYRLGDTTQLFRPEKNWQRMNSSANRMCMPEIPQELFDLGVNTMTQHCQDFIPKKSEQSLYLRPFMFGTKAELGLSVSDSYEFMVLASPSEVYHHGNMKILVERHGIRAAGEMGSAKASGNYAASLYVSQQARDKGYDQPLWLDPNTQSYVEELSGMNVFAVINGVLVTPELSGSFLPGITRESLIQLAKHLGIPVQE